LTDSSEQLPFTFSRLNDADIERATLPCGDDSLPGFEIRVSKSATRQLSGRVTE
jgi:hypothetical protein